MQQYNDINNVILIYTVLYPTKYNIQVSFSHMTVTEVKVDLIIHELRSPIVFLLAVTITRQVQLQRHLVCPERSVCLNTINNPISVSMQW